jgi:hypothetical protein
LRFGVTIDHVSERMRRPGSRERRESKGCD